MRAVILAAGRGSRMEGLTDERPKCLVQFRGKTLVDWQLHSLRSAGIDDIGIVTGYKRELLTHLDLTEFHNSRWAETNMVYSMTQASKWLSDHECLISYSDIFYTTDSIKRLMHANANIAITYDPNWLKLWSRRFSDPLQDAETFLEEDGKLTEIGNVPKNVKEVKGQYMGLLKLSPLGWSSIQSCLNSISTGYKNIDMTSLLSIMIKNENLIRTIPINEEWHEFDSISDLNLATEK
tara:strand:- start:5 stop:715 length:711 start_codon:yes stop_codon:yes gene_type:complete